MDFSSSHITDPVYLCIDLKSFYASVECADRGLDPFTTNLVVADPSRSDGTICLAVTPAMKALGVPGRCRVFEIPKDIPYITAPPRMRRYMEVSARIHRRYLDFVAPCDIHVYSIDECFIYATPYLRLYRTSPRELARSMMDAVFADTHICATAGIGSNLFLAKVALDVLAKKSQTHIGELDVLRFRETMWDHRPITDIWNIGPGTARRLAKYGVYDLRGVARMDPATLYREFGKNARYLIDHALGFEPCTIADIKAYVPKSSSLSNGQVLMRDYATDEARHVLVEMADELCRTLVDEEHVASGVGLWIVFGRDVWPPALSRQRRLAGATDSRRLLIAVFEELFDDLAGTAPIRRMGLTLTGVLPARFQTFDLFTPAADIDEQRRRTQAVSAVKERFGKNAVVLASSLLPFSTGRERNMQVGGHHE